MVKMGVLAVFLHIALNFVASCAGEDISHLRVESSWILAVGNNSNLYATPNPCAKNTDIHAGPPLSSFI